ncbi:hypothetical protein E4T43_07106 [Aureobasidium subglaciale]|nr:hypothetical protein E4T43_07106 [Aureobasidium subglaciale]
MSTDTPDEISLKVQEWLRDGPYACTSLDGLSGGTANFVYRGTLVAPLQDGSKTVVIKHTEGYVAQSPNFKLTTTRCDYEQTVLTALPSLSPSTHSNITVQTPTLHLFSPATNTQIYSDLPSSLDLKTYVLKYASAITHPQCLRLGHALGLWTRKFHDWAQAKEQEELVKSIQGNVAMRDLKFMINYERLVQSIDTYPKILEGSRRLFETVREGVRKDLDDGAVLIHGDFWSGNILLPDGPIPDQDDQLKVFVIDWELCQVSSQALDLGQMFAELFELKHFKDIDAGTWLIEAFIGGYGEIDEELAFETAVHLGVHLICWGSRVQGWGSKEHIERIVEVGKDFVVEGWGKNEAFFREGPLKCLFD